MIKRAQDKALNTPSVTIKITDWVLKIIKCWGFNYRGSDFIGQKEPVVILVVCTQVKS